jgi:hypothetical protein
LKYAGVRRKKKVSDQKKEMEINQEPQETEEPVQVDEL